jgi:hypothetical protein
MIKSYQMIRNTQKTPKTQQVIQLENAIHKYEGLLRCRQLRSRWQKTLCPLSIYLKAGHRFTKTKGLLA